MLDRHRRCSRKAGIAAPAIFGDPRRRFKKGGSSAPAGVNPAALGWAQYDANIGTAQKQSELNNINTYSPFGSSDFEQLPNGRWTLNQNLSPALQNVFGNETNLAGNIAGYGNNAANFAAQPLQGGANLITQGYNNWAGQLPSGPVSTAGLPELQGSAATMPLQTSVAGGGPIQTGLNFSGLPSLPTSTTDFSNEVGQAQQAAYNTQTGFLDPQFAEKQHDLQQQLADQGIAVGSDAYSRATGDLGRQETLAYQQAQNAAVQAGDQEQNTLFGENLASRQQGVNEALNQGNFANAAQAQQYGQNLQSGNFANQAAQQGFAENLANAGLADQARQQGLAERQSLWAEPFTALQQETGIGQNILGSGISDLTGLLPATNFNWAGAIPTFGANPVSVSPANLAGSTYAANAANQNRFSDANLLNNQLGGALGGLGSSLGLGSGGLGNLLFGSQGLSGALGLGSGGLFGSLFGGGAADAGAAAASGIDQLLSMGTILA